MIYKLVMIKSNFILHTYKSWGNLLLATGSTD